MCGGVVSLTSSVSSASRDLGGSQIKIRGETGTGDVDGDESAANNERAAEREGGRGGGSCEKRGKGRPVRSDALCFDFDRAIRSPWPSVLKPERPPDQKVGL